jgi:hypothetical protein
MWFKPAHNIAVARRSAAEFMRHNAAIPDKTLVDNAKS